MTEQMHKYLNHGNKLYTTLKSGAVIKMTKMNGDIIAKPTIGQNLGHGPILLSLWKMMLTIMDAALFNSHGTITTELSLSCSTPTITTAKAIT